MSFTPPDDSSLIDILHAARRLLRFMASVTREALSEDDLRQAAVVRQIEILGEGTKRLSAEFRAQHTNIDWKRVAGMRDVLIHAYDRVDIEEVWSVATTDAPNLIHFLEPLVGDLTGE